MIILSKEGIFFEDGTGELEKLQKPFGIWLDELAVVEEGFTVQNLLDFLNSNRREFNSMFKQNLNGSDIHDFWIDSITKDKHDSLLNDIDFIEFYHTCEIYETNINMDYTQSHHMHGVTMIHSHANSIRVGFHDVSFAKISTWSFLELKINPYYEMNLFKITNENLLDDMDDDLDERTLTLTDMRLKQNWSFGDIISTFLKEISYYGNPESRQNQYEELIQNLDRDALDDDNDFIPFNDFQDAFTITEEEYKKKIYNLDSDLNDKHNL